MNTSFRVAALILLTSIWVSALAAVPNKINNEAYLADDGRPRTSGLSGALSGRKWQDVNGNGQQDSEPGLAGVIIYLDLNNNGGRDSGEPTTVTIQDDPVTSFDETGTYLLAGLQAGTYVVREVVPDGFVQTFPQSGFHQVSLPPDAGILDLDFGNQPTASGSLHGRKWLDSNGNSQHDANEPGLAGVTIYLDLNNNGSLDTGEPLTVTIQDDPNTSFDEAGLYWLEDLQPATYIVREVVPNGLIQTFPLLGFHRVTLMPDGSIEDLDFGNQPISSGSLHGRKWLDANGNGQRDTNEPGLAGVTIYLDLNNNGSLDTGEPFTVTMQDDPNTSFDEAGLYWLTGLQPGTYIVREVVPNGFVQTFPLSGIHQVALTPGQTINGLDFGNRAILTGFLHGRKWLDANGNGQRDTNEPGLAGVTIYLDLNNNGSLDAGEPFTVTMQDDPNTSFDEAGLYWLEGLMPGTYVVREVVPNGFVQTFPQSLFHVVTLTPGGVIEGLDFGNFLSPVDSDNDGIIDSLDNCIDVFNPDQRDTNQDGYGNICDADLDNNNFVNFIDLSMMQSAFFSNPASPNWNWDADLDGDDVVNFLDLIIVQAQFFGPPGPSGIAP